MNKTLGAPSLARKGSGQAGEETSNVRPITPLNALPGLYSFNAIKTLLSYSSFSLRMFGTKELEEAISRSSLCLQRAISDLASSVVSTLVLTTAPTSVGLAMIAQTAGHLLSSALNKGQEPPHGHKRSGSRGTLSGA
jgi:hypothetical protein